jgi:predicted nucleic acid-binding protein
VVETSFFLDARAKVHLLDLVQSGRIRSMELPTTAFANIAAIIDKYADRDIDFADAALVWLADQSGCRSILTVDLRDFGVYRLKGGKRFEVVKWIT